MRRLFSLRVLRVSVLLLKSREEETVCLLTIGRRQAESILAGGRIRGNYFDECDRDD